MSGYKSYTFSTKEKSIRFKIHRVVAKLYVPNPDPETKDCVNHINGDRMDARAVNLEWCTYTENNQHAIDTGLIPLTKKAVIRYNLDTGDVKTYESIKVASEKTGINDGLICHVLSGARKSAGGYDWCYLEDQVNITSDVDLSTFKQIIDFPNYLINDQGQIYSLAYKRFLKFQNHKHKKC